MEYAKAVLKIQYALHAMTLALGIALQVGDAVFCSILVLHTTKPIPMLVRTKVLLTSRD